MFTLLELLETNLIYTMCLNWSVLSLEMKVHMWSQSVMSSASWFAKGSEGAMIPWINSGGRCCLKWIV